MNLQANVFLPKGDVYDSVLLCSTPSDSASQKVIWSIICTTPLDLQCSTRTSYIYIYIVPPPLAKYNLRWSAIAQLPQDDMLPPSYEPCTCSHCVQMTSEYFPSVYNNQTLVPSANSKVSKSCGSLIYHFLLAYFYILHGKKKSRSVMGQNLHHATMHLSCPSFLCIILRLEGPRTKTFPHMQT